MKRVGMLALASVMSVGMMTAVLGHAAALKVAMVVAGALGDRSFYDSANDGLTRAAQELGIRELPCKVLKPDTPAEKLRAITIKDNIPYGQWDMDSLANEWEVADLEAWGMDVFVSLGNY